MKSRPRLSPRHIGALAAIAAFAITMPAKAHHPMGGATPGNWMEGLLSGWGHPIIGADHLLFIVAAGIACFYFGQRMTAIAAFIAATAAGTLMRLQAPAIPLMEAAVAVSLVVLGVLLYRRSAVLGSRSAVGLFAIFGLAHGYAYGEAIVGAETTPLLAYLAGFTSVQFAIALCAYAAARTILTRQPAFPLPQTAGGALSLAGTGFLVYALML